MTEDSGSKHVMVDPVYKMTPKEQKISMLDHCLLPVTLSRPCLAISK